MNNTDFQYINDAFLYSKAKYNEIKTVLPNKNSIDEYICVFLVGSYGRFEASKTASDIEWIIVYDDKRVGKQEANLYHAKISELFAKIMGREKLSIGKTFGEVISKSDLITNVGGIADTSQTLTYRMLCLSEGKPFYENKTYKQILSDLAFVYGASHTAGHRLLSFATDIGRYWRTLRIDYKQKIDEQKKHWAVRGFKLRGLRRYWYFSMILHFIAFAPRLAREEDDVNESKGFELQVVMDYMLSIKNHPTGRILESAKKLKVDNKKVSTLINCYNELLELISKETVREELNNLQFEKRYESDNYRKSKELCNKLHKNMAYIILDLPEFERNQVIEMFLL